MSGSADLWGHGASWWDRHYGTRPPSTSTGSADDAARWRDAVDPDAAGLFERRLAWDGWTSDDVPRLLGIPRMAEPPWWWDDLQHMRSFCRAAEPPVQADPDGPAFAELLQPLVNWNWLELESELAAGTLAGVTEQARVSLRRSLLVALSEVCASACAADFTADRPVGQQLLLRLGVAPATHSATRYLAWCSGQLADGLGGLLAKYPVLGRLIAVTAAHWRSSTSTMLRRVASDRAEIAAAFGIPAHAPLCAVRVGLSDPHRGGQSVAVVGFGDPGAPAWVVYKPKDMRIERHFHHLMSTVGRWFPEGPVGLTVVSVGADHGYESFVAHEPCAPDRLPDFYRDAGRLLAVLHVLGATDAHFENLIASGTSLHLIDAETLFHGRTAIRAGVGDRADGSHDGPLSDSVLRVGMLPGWLIGGRRNVPHDVSALGVAPASPTGTRPGWCNVGTDDISWGMVPHPPAHPASLPVPVGVENPLEEHAAEVVRGYSEVHRLLRESRHRTEIRRLIANFIGSSRRVVLRATRVYAETQREALRATALTSSNLRGFELERLARSSLLTEQPSPYWQVFHAELYDMEQLDIPYFDHELGSAVLRSSLGPIEGVLTSDGIAESLDRVDSADDEGLAWQLRLIRGAIAARFRLVNAPAEATERTVDVTPAEAPAAPAIIDDVLQSLSESAIDDGRGGLTWLILAAVANTERVQLSLMGDGLYDGRAGLAALLVAEPGRFPRTAEDILAPIGEAVRDRDGYTRFRYVRDLGVGWAGVGGFLRILERVNGPGADWFDRILAEVSVELIRRDRYLDVIGGVAGLIGPLARICARRPDERHVALLRAAAEHLAEGQGADGGWPPQFAPRPLTGLAHGAGGMGLALLEAGVCLDDDALVAAGARGFGYETAVFEEKLGNWPDFRRAGDGDPAFMNAWCHGAPGIGLSRLRALELLPGHADAVRWSSDLETAMTTTMQARATGPDHLCCGVIGRAAVLRIAGRVRQCPQWLTASDALTEAVCARYAQEGFFRLPLGDPTDPRVATPTLMSGSAGIAMHLSTRLRDTDLRWLLLP